MADKYPSMTSLTADTSLVEGIDYTFTVIENPFSTVGVTAPHGGNIERGTSELADLIREYGNYNYFSFDVLKTTNASDLHVTSTNYDEPRILNMMARCSQVVGCHGKSGTDLTVYVGGLASPLRNAIWTKLNEAGFNCEISPSGIAGLEPDNITNRSKTGGGVQLEITTELRKSFFIDGDWTNRSRENWTQKIYDFATAVYQAIEENNPSRQMDTETSYKMDLKGNLDYGAGYKTELYADSQAVQADLNANRNNWTEAYSRVQDWAGATENGKVTVNGGMLTANSVIADKLAIGNFENAYQNGSFELGMLGWKPASAWTIINDPTAAYGGNYYAKGVWGSASSISFYDQKEIIVREGDKWYWEGLFRTDVATTTKTRTMLIKLIDKAGTETFIIKEETLTTSWQKFYYTFDIPVGTVKIVLGLSVKGGQPAGFNTLVDNVFAKKMMTGELIVDGTISGTAIKAGSLLADAISGGTLTLGGSNKNGIMQLLNSNDEQVAYFDADNKGFSALYVGDLDSPTVVEYGEQDINLFVSDRLLDYSGAIEPNDDNNGTSWSSPLSTVTEALRRIPKYYAGTAVINVAYNSLMYESFEISGFVGTGSITLSLGSAKFYGNPVFKNNMLNIFSTGGVINGKKLDYAVVSLLRNAYVRLEGMKVYGNGSSMNYDTTAGFTEMVDCETYGADLGISSRYGGRVFISNAKGSAATYGLHCYGGDIFGQGTAPTGGSNAIGEVAGGKVMGSFTFGSTSGGSMDAQPTTVTLNATDANSYRDTFGGSWINDEVAQGKWGSYGIYRGLWYFSMPNLSGKTILKVRMYVKRKAEAGIANAITAYFRPHRYTSKPSGAPSYDSQVANASFKQNEGKWITIPSSFYAGFVSGSYKGIGIYTNSTNQNYYAKFDATAKLEITYK